MNTIFSRLCYMLLLICIVVACKKDKSMIIVGRWEVYQTKTEEGLKDTRECHYCFNAYVTHGITFNDDKTFRIRWNNNGTWSEEKGMNGRYEQGDNMLLLYNNDSPVIEQWGIIKSTSTELHLLNKTGYEIYLRKTE